MRWHVFCKDVINNAMLIQTLMHHNRFITGPLQVCTRQKKACFFLSSSTFVPGANLDIWTYNVSIPRIFMNVVIQRHVFILYRHKSVPRHTWIYKHLHPQTNLTYKTHTLTHNSHTHTHNIFNHT